MKEDIFFYGCKYVYDGDMYYYVRNETYDEVSAFLFPALKKPIQTAFDLSDEQMSNITYSELYMYSDAQLAEDFEGIPRRYNYTHEQWYYMRET